LPDGSPPKPRRIARAVGFAAALAVLVLAVLVLAITLLGTKQTTTTTTAAGRTSAAAPAAPASPPWETFLEPTFRAQFPSPPRSSPEDVATAGFTSHGTVWEAAGSTGDYYVTRVGAPAGQTFSLPAALTSAVAGSARTSHATVTSTRTFAIGPYSVEDATLALPGNFVVSERIMATPQVAWILGAVGRAGPAADWQRFLKSFDPTS